MKTIKKIIAFIMIANVASVHFAFSQDKILLASYACEYKVPESIKSIENERIRERAISALKGKSGTYNLYVKGPIYAFTSDIKEANKKGSSDISSDTTVMQSIES